MVAVLASASGIVGSSRVHLVRGIPEGSREGLLVPRKVLVSVNKMLLQVGLV